MTINSIKTLAAAAAMATLASCGTDVEFCHESTHPHAATVAFNFSFDNDSDAPDTMLVIANRVVARRVSAMAISPATGYGHAVSGNVLIADEPAEDTTTEATSLTRQAGTDANQHTRTFQLPVGTYRFIALNIDTAEFSYSNVGQFLSGQSGMNMSDVNVEYRVYTRRSPLLRSPLVDWQDNNPYAGYMQPDIKPLLVDTVRTDLANGQTRTINMRPTPVTQNIDLYVNITKRTGSQRFRVDSVYAELSGIARRVYITSGNLDINQTAKMLFKMRTVNSAGAELADTDDSWATVRCHANIDVTGIVPSQNSTLGTGPGILQLMVFVSAPNEDNPSGERAFKKIQGKINIYNTLSRAHLTEYVDDGLHARRTTSHGTLTVNAPVEIDGQSVVENPDNDFGVDAWIACDDIEVDI